MSGGRQDIIPHRDAGKENEPQLGQGSSIPRQEVGILRDPTELTSPGIQVMPKESTCHEQVPERVDGANDGVFRPANNSQG